MDSKAKRRSIASLTVYSSTLSGQELVELVPVRPDRTVQKGTQQGKDPRIRRPYSLIDFESRVDGSADPEAHIEDLLLRLDPAKDALRSYAQRTRSEVPRLGTTVYLRLKVESTDREFGFEISDEQLRAIADLGAHLGVEVEFDEEGLDA